MKINQKEKKNERKKEAPDLQKPQNIHHSYNQSLLPLTQISKVALDERTTRNRATIYPKRRRQTKKQEEKERVTRSLCIESRGIIGVCRKGYRRDQTRKLPRGQVVRVGLAAGPACICIKDANLKR